jgi:hypothetical protein
MGLKKTAPATQQHKPGVSSFNNVTPEKSADDFSVHSDVEDESAERTHMPLCQLHLQMDYFSPQRS